MLKPRRKQELDIRKCKASAIRQSADIFFQVCTAAPKNKKLPRHSPTNATSSFQSSCPFSKIDLTTPFFFQNFRFFSPKCIPSPLQACKYKNIATLLIFYRPAAESVESARAEPACCFGLYTRGLQCTRYCRPL